MNSWNGLKIYFSQKQKQEIYFKVYLDTFFWKTEAIKLLITFFQVNWYKSLHHVTSNRCGLRYFRKIGEARLVYSGLHLRLTDQRMSGKIFLSTLYTEEIFFCVHKHQIIPPRNLALSSKDINFTRTRAELWYRLAQKKYRFIENLFVDFELGCNEPSTITANIPLIYQWAFRDLLFAWDMICFHISPNSWKSMANCASWEKKAQAVKWTFSCNAATKKWWVIK